MKSFGLSAVMCIASAAFGWFLATKVRPPIATPERPEIRSSSEQSPMPSSPQGHREELGDVSLVASEPEAERESDEPEGQSFSVDSFVIHFADQHADWADFSAEVLGLALGNFMGDYGFEEPQDFVEVVLQTRESFAKAVGQSVSQKVSGIFDGKIRIAIDDTTENELIAKTLRHELVHALLAPLGPLPQWFEEGLAQRLECSYDGCESRGQNQQRFGDFSTELMSSFSWGRQDPAKFYAQSLFVIESMESWYGPSFISDIVLSLSQRPEQSLQKTLQLLDSNLTLTSLIAKSGERWNRVRQ